MSFFSLSRRLTWELTKQCDRGCAHCVSALYYRAVPDELDPAAALAVAERCREARIGHIHLLGGEPTARHDLPTLLDRCAALDIGVSMTTNGLALAGQLGSDLARATSLRALYVSFEDVREAEADAIRGPGAFAAACEGLRRVRREAPELPLVVAFTVTRPALEALEPAALLEAFARLGASRVLFQDLAVPSNAEPSLSRLGLDGPLWLGFLERLFDHRAAGPALPFDYPLKPLVAEHLGERLGRPLGQGRYVCAAGDRDLRLLPNGSLLPCSAAVGWSAALEASILAAPPLPEVSFDEALAATFHRRFVAAREARREDPVMEPCRTCHLAYAGCNPCPYGRLLGEEHRVQGCSWVVERSGVKTRRTPSRPARP